MGSNLEKITITGAGAAVVMAGAVIASAAAGSAFGAIGGEILDHIPYLKRAIPEGIGYLANYINPESAEKATTALKGNLDKIGAALGFFAGFYRKIVSFKKN